MSPPADRRLVHPAAAPPGVVGVVGMGVGQAGPKICRGMGFKRSSGPARAGAWSARPAAAAAAAAAATAALAAGELVAGDVKTLVLRGGW